MPEDLAALFAHARANWDEFDRDSVKDVNDRGYSGDAMLHKYAINGDVESAKILIENGADVNASGEDGDTPLHRAWICEDGDNRRKMISLLLSNGADKTLRNMYGISNEHRREDGSILSLSLSV